MTVRHDKSTTSIVTTCTECPYWYAFNFEAELAEAAAIRHKMTVHDMPEAKARKAERERARRMRHAAAV
ncbi:hypothetical protein [Agromyces larvae]|uniref:Uncharacterized protein n=1 Tax=Agromyces larvae TaxID=2929802 RepID=A0ABY4BYC6_9MICO|nr:hypothetical protein [Agromyces larvae]UOE43739.1 hypothetical protein MTO99_16445 [Agromyces larvae]